MGFSAEESERNGEVSKTRSLKGTKNGVVSEGFLKREERRKKLVGRSKLPRAYTEPFQGLDKGVPLCG